MSLPKRGAGSVVAILIAFLAVAVGAAALWRAPELAAWYWHFKAGKPTMSTARPSLIPPLHWFDDYFAVADLGQGTFAIGEPFYGQCNFSYLIVGASRALLFDTGPGVLDIRPVAESLTHLPIEALPSHLHFDHVGNLARFADVDLPDLPGLKDQVVGGKFVFRRYQYLGFVEGMTPPTFPVHRWIAPDSDIDLGGRTLKVLNLPGHTPDSIVLIDAAANRVFAGDFIYPSDIYAQLPGADLAAYAASARRLLPLLNDQTQVLGAHGCDPPPDAAVPSLAARDVRALGTALDLAARGNPTDGSGFYPREIPVNAHMKLLAKYPWMRP